MSESKYEREPIVGDRPPRDGKQYDCQCARCGSSMAFERCEEWDCQDGYVVESDRFDEDDMVQTRKCDICRGRGGWYVCLSSREWCEANPLEGRLDVMRGQVEWFEVEEEN